MADQKDQNKPADKKSVIFEGIEKSEEASGNPPKLDEQLMQALTGGGIENVASSTGGPLTSLVKSMVGGGMQKKNVKLAFYEDPIEISDYAGLFKTKRKLLPDHVLKLIRVQNHLVASILRARGNTMAMHGHKRRDRFDVGMEVRLKPEFEQYVKPEQMIKIRERIERAEKLLLSCGSVQGISEDERMSLSEFLDLQARNGLTFGRFATEIIYDSDGPNRKFHSFRPVDVGTIYNTVKKGEYGAQAVRESSAKKLEELTGIKIDINKLREDQYSYIQAIDGIPMQAFTHEELVIYNLYPSTDVEHAGYPVTPIDTCISSITTHLSIDAYNRLYFQNGRAAKGMLVVKSEEIDQATLNKIRQDFVASVNSVNNAFRAPVFGVNPTDDVMWIPMTSNAGDGEFQFLYDQVARNILSTFNMSPDELPGYGHLSRGTNQQMLCLDLSSRVLTKDGVMELGNILGDDEEAFFDVWTGTSWEKARAFRSGERRRIKTEVSNGTEIITSPDHRFRVIDESGAPSWKHQKDLTLDDWVLVNGKNASSEKPLPSYNGKQLNEGMMEVLGWLTGDGNISLRYNKNTGNVKQGVLTWFYHHSKECDLWEKHAVTIRDFGLDVSHKKTYMSEETVKARMDSCFANSAANVKITNVLYDTAFVKFLTDIGFTSSTEGKSIPSFLYSAPESAKAAFLRGFFSADGTLSKNSSPKIVIHSDKLRNQTKELLLSMGIRTQRNEGKFKHHPDRSREPVEAKTYLVVKDKTRFFDKIGFLQDHKQPDLEDLEASRRWEKIPRSVAKRYVPQILKAGENTLLRVDRNNLQTLLNDSVDRTISLDRLKRYMRQVGVEVPSWMEDYHLERVVSVVDMEEVVEMGDVEVFNKDHAFVANGMVVHNSESGNEFKLTAARDTGLRPLILRFQAFFNEKLLPIVDPELAQICYIQLSGLDAQSREQESLRLQQDMPIHMTMDEVLGDVDKHPIGKSLAGDFPFNERWQIIADKMIKIAELKEAFLEDPTSIVDPMLQYPRDPFFFQNLNVMMQANPLAVKAYYANKPYVFDIMKMMAQDYLDEDDEE